MKIQAFVPSWPSKRSLNTDAIVAAVSARYPTTVLSDPDDYFNAQWQKARDQFTGDVLLWIMADAQLPDNLGGMFTEMERMMKRGDIGWYAPDIEWTSYIYQKKHLKLVEHEVYEVPNTDSVVFAIRADVIKKMPLIDPAVCFMWGMDVFASTVIRNMGLKMVRDYKFKVGHPNNTGYDIEQASSEMGRLFRSLEPDFREQVQETIDVINSLKRLP